MAANLPSLPSLVTPGDLGDELGALRYRGPTGPRRCDGASVRPLGMLPKPPRYPRTH